MSLEDTFTSYPLYLAIFCIYLSGVIASAGGIGGGGVVMPLLLVIGKFPIHKAVILSQCAVFGNNFAQSYINFNRSHPYDVYRPLIYYDIAMVILPAQLGGSFIGVIISKIFPETVLIILAIVTLLYAIYRTFKKALIYYRSENTIYATNQTMYEKLLEKSIHSPTKIGKKFVYSEQVSIFDEEEGGDEDDDIGEENDEDDGFHRLISEHSEEDLLAGDESVIDDVNVDDDTMQTERLVNAATQARATKSRQHTSKSQRNPNGTVTSNSMSVSHTHTNLSSVKISNIDSTSSVNSGGSELNSSRNHSNSHSHRMDSSEFFRDSHSHSTAENRHIQSHTLHENVGGGEPEYDGTADGTEDQPTTSRSRRESEFRDSQDTVLFNPLTLSLTTSKNIKNALLISTTISPHVFEEEKRSRSRSKQKKSKTHEEGDDDDEEDFLSRSSSRSSASSGGRRSLQGVTMMGGVPVSNGTTTGTGTGNNKQPILRILPRFQLTVIAIIWSLYCGLYVIMQYTTKECTNLYFMEMSSIYPILIGTVIYVIHYLKYYQHHHLPLTYLSSTTTATGGNTGSVVGSSTGGASGGQAAYLRILQGDIDFAKSSWAIPCCGFLVGILTSLLGIGGGELLGPLFLAYHMLPQVSTATTSMMSLLNSANNLVHYAILDELTYSLAGTFVLVGIASGTTGRQAALYFSQKYGRVSFLVFMLTAILCLSVMLLVYESSTKEFDFNLHALCD